MEFTEVASGKDINKSLFSSDDGMHSCFIRIAEFSISLIVLNCFLVWSLRLLLHFFIRYQRCNFTGMSKECIQMFVAILFLDENKAIMEQSNKYFIDSVKVKLNVVLHLRYRKVVMKLESFIILKLFSNFSDSES